MLRRRTAVALATAVVVSLAFIGVPATTGGSTTFDPGAAAATSTPSVPRPAAPRPRLASVFNRAPPAAKRRQPTTPLKDLAVEGQLLSVAPYTSLLNLAKSAKTNVITAGVAWSSLEPNGPAPANEWANLDAFVAAVRARGMQVRFQVYGFPDWAHDWVTRTCPRSSGWPRPVVPS